MWCAVFLFPICYRSTTYSQGTYKSSAPEETLQHWLGLIFSLWKPLKAPPALLFWWNSIYWKKNWGKFSSCSNCSWNLTRQSGRNQGRGALLWGRSKCEAVSWSETLATGPALYGQFRLTTWAKMGLCLRKTDWRTWSCYTLRSTNSGPLTQGRCFVSTMLLCLKGTVPSTQWAKLVKSTLK